MKMAKDMFNPEMMKKYSEVGVKVQALQTELASTEVECTTADGRPSPRRERRLHDTGPMNLM